MHLNYSLELVRFDTRTSNVAIVMLYYVLFILTVIYDTHICQIVRS